MTSGSQLHRAHQLRLRLKPKAPRTGYVDGAWWPRSHDLAAELPIERAKHDPGVVAVYLHTFQAMDEQGWSTLEELLAEDARLQLGKKE